MTYSSSPLHLNKAISVALVHLIGVSEQAHAIFNELQITKFSVPIRCRRWFIVGFHSNDTDDRCFWRCNQSGFVDKREFEQNKVLFCPFPNCSCSWCRDCQQEISRELDGPVHSCDGSEEFNHLMSRKGWKHCPGCHTPTEKIQGCNHMTVRDEYQWWVLFYSHLLRTVRFTRMQHVSCVSLVNHLISDAF